MTTQTEHRPFFKETGEIIDLNLQHLDQFMDQLDKLGDKYYVPAEGIHLVKLADDELLVLATRF